MIPATIRRTMLCLCVAAALAGCRSQPRTAPQRRVPVTPLVTGTAVDPSVPQVPHIVGRGTGRLDHAVLRSGALRPGARVQIALFDNQAIVAAITHAIEDGADRTWLGTTDPGGDRVLMHYRDGRFGFVARRPLAGDVEIGSCRDHDCAVTHFRAGTPVRCSTSGGSLSAPRRTDRKAAADTIDLLVLYTDGVVGEWALWNDPQIARGDLETWVKETNLSFSCSGVAARLRLAGVKRVRFAESGKPQDDLRKWIDPGGQEWPVIDAERAEAGADLVSIVVSTGDDDGAANAYAETPRYDKFAISVVVRQVALGLQVFSHEIGHLLGAGHQEGGGVFADDSHAWQFYSGSSEYVTIMFAGAASRIGHFSNPSVCYHFAETGVRSTADNVHAIAYTGPKVSAFRDSRSMGPVAAISCPYDTACPSRASR